MNVEWGAEERSEGMRVELPAFWAFRNEMCEGEAFHSKSFRLLRRCM